MEKLRKLITVAVTANIISLLLFYYMNAYLNGAEELTWYIMLLIFPVLWITAMLIAIILSYKNRNVYFKKALVFYTVFILLLCTPLPVFSIVFGLVWK